MKVSQLLGTTLREASQEVELVSHQLLLRAGYIRQLGSGIFSVLHLGQRSLAHIEQILREEMDAIGGVEISMPVVHPADIWQQTGRYDSIDESLLRFKDRFGRDMVLAMTHEEVVASLLATEISSYRQLPKLVYQIQTKFRDELRPRGGLIRVREFRMKDSYSLDATWEGLEKQYEAHYDAYHRIFARLGLPVEAVLSDVGMMGGAKAHEFMYLTPVGEDTVFFCSECDYKANKEVATIGEPGKKAPLVPMETVHTPGTRTITQLCEFLGIEASQTAKVVFFTASHSAWEADKLVIGVVRGDMEANALVLQKACGAEKLVAATEEEIRATGAEPGFGSPVGLVDERIFVVVDQVVAESSNLVTGANEADYHVLNANYGRDYQADVVTPLALAYEGAPCPICESGHLVAHRGVEVGNIFQLGPKYAEAMGATFMDESGRPQPVIMGSYGIGVGRALACLAEHYHDADGLRFPLEVAPFQVMLVSLAETEEVVAAAEALYESLRSTGVEVLYDDRDKKAAGPGIKFKDADLRGIPIRLTVARRTLESGGAELKLRDAPDKELIAMEEVLERVQALMANWGRV